MSRKQQQNTLFYLACALLFCVGFSASFYAYFYTTHINDTHMSAFKFSEKPPMEYINERNGSYAVPPIPSLNILGPPKCGTRSLVDMLSLYSNVVQFGFERAFWNGANKWKCQPILSKEEWTQYIDGYNTSVQRLANMVGIIQSHKDNQKCNVDRYQMHWNERFNLTKRIQTKYTGFHNMHCIHPKYALTKYTGSLLHNIEYTSDMNKYCHLIEKGPSQSRVPWVPIVFANLLPKTKLLTILRNPIYHVTSAFVSLGRGRGGFDTTLQMKKHIISELNDIEAFPVLNEICNAMNHEWNALNNKGIVGIDRYWQMHNIYKHFIVTYLQRKFVEPRDIAPGVRNKIFIWGPFSFPVFLFALFSWDEVLDNHEWKQFTEIESYRVVQFEWLWSDIARSMKVIKCWVMNLKQSECDKHISDGENMKIFASKDQKKNHIKNATNMHERWEWYEENIRRVYNPCYDALKHIILFDRPSLLLGEWNSWNYSYID